MSKILNLNDEDAVTVTEKASATDSDGEVGTAAGTYPHYSFIHTKVSLVTFGSTQATEVSGSISTILSRPGISPGDV